MGDPRKIRKKYETPSHPWQMARIEEEKKIKKEYGLKNKKELWKMTSKLKSFKDQIKSLSSRIDKQSRLEEKQLVDRLVSMGLLKHGDAPGKILSLTLKDITDRRLQAFLVKKGMARTMKQARQFITHGHLLVSGKRITFPSYFVNLKDEGAISFISKSALSRDDHPERIQPDKEDHKAKGSGKKKKDEEAAPAFAEKEIVKIEETGAVEPAVVVDAPN